MPEDSDAEVTVSVKNIEDEKIILQQLQEELNSAKISVQQLSAKLEEQNQKKRDVLSELRLLRERITDAGAQASVQKLIPRLQSLKALERQESLTQSYSDAKRSALEAAVKDLEAKALNGCDSKTLTDDINHSLSESLDQLNCAKKELAAPLRKITSLKRQLDDVPCQSELIQYERRSSELNTYIQEKLQQTRKYYATYNALLEIKELMLKETSLLNSISSQFQDAITNPVGRTKLINSMEGIVKSSQQKLEKVQKGLKEEQKVFDALKEKYMAATAEQRRCYALLKAFQEECAENNRLRSKNQD